VSISLKAVHSKFVASRCEVDPTALQQDMLCPITRTIIEYPVKCFDGNTHHTYERAAIEKYFEFAQQNGKVAISPLTKRRSQTEKIMINGNLHLVLQADEEMRTKIEILHEENRVREERQKNEA